MHTNSIAFNVLYKSLHLIGNEFEMHCLAPFYLMSMIAPLFVRENGGKLAAEKTR
jgi:hypothetical protein